MRFLQSIYECFSYRVHCTGWCPSKCWWLSSCWILKFPDIPLWNLFRSGMSGHCSCITYYAWAVSMTHNDHLDEYECLYPSHECLSISLELTLGLNNLCGSVQRFIYFDSSFIIDLILGSQGLQLSYEILQQRFIYKRNDHLKYNRFFCWENIISVLRLL